MPSNKEVVRRHYEDGVNRGDLDVATECFAPEYVNHLPGEPEPQRGIAAWKAMFQSFRAGFPDMATTLEDLISENDRVVVRHRWTGTHDGEYQGVAPTGTRVTSPATTSTGSSTGRSSRSGPSSTSWESSARSVR